MEFMNLNKIQCGRRSNQWKTIQLTGVFFEDVHETSNPMNGSPLTNYSKKLFEDTTYKRIEERRARAMPRGKKSIRLIHSNLEWVRGPVNQKLQNANRYDIPRLILDRWFCLLDRSYLFCCRLFKKDNYYSNTKMMMHLFALLLY